MSANSWNVLALAHLCDAVYELFIRGLICGPDRKVYELHRRTVHYVCAAYQAKVYDFLLPQLDEAETAVLKRGRNCNTSTVPKNGCPADYRKATGVEALLGFLYADGRLDRLRVLLDSIKTGLIDKEEGGE